MQNDPGHTYRFNAYQRDPIIASSTAPGFGFKAILRLSGDQLKDQVAPLFSNTLKDRQWQFAQFKLNDATCVPVSACLFLAPHSFTGQDVLEIQLPGQPTLIDRFIRKFQQLDIRLAEPGEFTFRAFTSGKIDLIQAEGIGATIHASNQDELRAAKTLREGKLGQIATELVNDLAEVLALLEAGIDFTDEEDVVPIPIPRLQERLENIEARIEDIQNNSRRWSNLQAEPRVTLVGPPSSGKSSLFNHLVNQERAVIDEAHGTTRDILEEKIELLNESGTPVKILLTDIAGLDHMHDNNANENTIDSAAQINAQKTIKQSDLLLIFVPVNSQKINDHYADQKRIVIHSKCDLMDQIPQQTNDFYISTITGQGLNDLKKTIVSEIEHLPTSNPLSQKLVLQPRHDHALSIAKDHIQSSLKCIHNHFLDNDVLQSELLASYMRHALDCLASLGGQVSPDEIIGKIFSNFCIGK